MTAASVIRARSLAAVAARLALAGALVAVLATAGGCAAPSADGGTGRVLHVARGGNDLLGDGSAERPWATIQHAADSASAGDTVRVAAGTYNERPTIPVSSSGSESTSTAFVADGPVVVSHGFEIEANNVRLEGFEITPGEARLKPRVGQVQVTGNENTLVGLNIHDTASGAGVSFDDGAWGNTLSQFKIHRSPEFGIVFGSYGEGGAGYKSATSNLASNGSVSESGGWAGIEISGEDNTVDGVTVSGGPSGWNTASPGVSQSNPYPDGDGIRVQGPRATIRNTVVHDLWEWFHDTQHTDCIQFWTDADGLLIENCILGTWQPGPEPAERGGLEREIGPSQIIMAGTVPAGQNITYTVRNTRFLGECGTGASIVSATEDGAKLKACLYNNTFWSSRPSVTPGSVLRNNIFRTFYLYPASLALDSDHNVFLWEGGPDSNNVPECEGPHSVGRTFETRPAGLLAPDVSEKTGWGLRADFRPQGASIAAGSVGSTATPPPAQ